ncbi:WD repeat-containing protein slp1 [Mycoemilia scoparia]|uniref:WD repeat-containing protein slp1 n=1 Tax=Mycoemilia scoparia TaxID=417184 RepID=A0A9W7ZZG8_9FUNG|nr:WD repeat-containing protein slp1 [Mycoemilia scoparia]
MSDHPSAAKSQSSFAPLSPRQPDHGLKPMVTKSDRMRQLNQSPRSISRKSSAYEVYSSGHASASTSPKKSSGHTNGGAGGRRTKAAPQYDRFIPNRNTMDMASSQFNLANPGSLPAHGNDGAGSVSGSDCEQPGNQTLDSTKLAYQEEVAKACGVSLNKRILAFNTEAPISDKEDIRQLYSRPQLKTSTSTANKRRILTTPDRVLDAPGLIDDYYLNLLDWSSSNILAIGLDHSVYLWNADTGDVSSLCELSGAENDDNSPYVSSVNWSADGSYLAIGTSDGDCQIWDADAQSKIRSMTGHQARVGSLSWSKHILTSGCRDGSIWHHDVRVASHKVGELLAHSGEVCGLKWRSDGQLLASGGNDNLVNIWDARASVPKFTKTNHTAAVKALAWSPWQLNLLATGGGSYDRHVHFWNTTTTARLHSIDTGSQVTSIIWSNQYKELVTSHGFPDNHLAIWSYPSLSKIVDIPAHDTRVLHSAISPDGQTVATVASDENLKFWKLFETKAKSAKTASAIGAAAMGSNNASLSAAIGGKDSRSAAITSSFETRTSIR